MSDVLRNGGCLVGYSSRRDHNISWSGTFNCSRSDVSQSKIGATFLYMLPGRSCGALYEFDVIQTFLVPFSIYVTCQDFLLKNY